MSSKKRQILDVERVFANETTGLTTEQVKLRCDNKLNNQTQNNITDSYLKIIVKNVCTFFNLLCLICFVAMLIAKADWREYTFMVIYVINFAIGIFQEIRAKRTLDKLSIVSTPTSKVIRNGSLLVVSVNDIVRDDILILELGDQIPADATVISGFIEVNESLLTGESVPIKKVEGSTLLSGSFVSSGSCYCRVDKVGNQSYVQQLSIQAKKLKSANSKLLQSINLIIKTVGILIFPIAAVTAYINYNAFTVAGLVGQELLKQVVTRTATVILGMIPAGMFLLTSMALAVGVIKLSRMNTLVKELYSLEMLARVDVLCLDKTGTITDGNMVVKEIIPLNDADSLMIDRAVYSLVNSLGDTNQTAEALRAYFKTGEMLTVTQKMPFSSQKKLSAVTFEQYGTYVLGAPKFIFEKLERSVSSIIKTHALLGRRVLMLAHSLSSIENDTLPTDLSAVALIVIEDNIRPEAIETIKWFKENDVEVKVISGDDPLTVSQISQRAGIDNAKNYIDLTGLSETEIQNIAEKYTVFGRVSPEQKAYLVKALKKHKHTVAMTGDGVNDILAMKEADCSITVDSGSSSAKSVSHLVLMDNNFNSMPHVVKEGRRVINNIQQSSSLYLMKTLFTITFAIISIIKMSDYPYTPNMMLALEFLIIGVPSFFLSLQPNNDRVSGNFIVHVMCNSIPGAIILVFNSLIVPFILKAVNYSVSSDLLKTMQVVVLTFGGWASLVRLCLPANKLKGILITAISVILFIWVFYIIPTPLFNLTAFTFPGDWQAILIVSCVILFDFPMLWLLDAGLNKIRGIKPKRKKKLVA